VTEQQNPSENQPKKLVLRRRKRVAAETTQGRLFARHIVTGDLPTFAEYVDEGNATTSADYEALGKLALLALVCADDGEERVPALTEETFSLLTETDIVALVQAVAEACELAAPSTIVTLAALGSGLFSYLSSIAKQMAESSAAIKRSIESSFSSVSQSLRSELQDKFSALSEIQSALGSSSAVEAIRQAQERNSTLLGTSSHSRFAPFQSAPPPFDNVRVPNYEAFIPPKFEDTPAGRTAARVASAGEESARQLSEVAGLMGKMAGQMAELQTVFLSKVLPEWFRNLEDSASTTNTTLRQAESSLFWAKWALLASVVVSVLMTGWQVWLAREYKLENDKQQEGTELLMRQQLKAIQELNTQLARKATQDTGLPHESTGSVAGKGPKTAGTHKHKPLKAAD